MQSQEHSCALRALTLCDGHVASGLPPRALDADCYCAALSEQLSAGRPELASEVRTTRARVLARASEVERIRRWRETRAW